MERIDDLQLKGLKIIQDTDLFCFGTDAVLLADFVRPKKNMRIADLGTGTGILPLLLYGRQEEIEIEALELQESLFHLARRSMELNGLTEKVRVVGGNIQDARALLCGKFDVVVSNPPYERENAGISSKSESHRLARFEVALTFDMLCASARSLLMPGGKSVFIHRASRTAELFGVLQKHGMQPKEARFIHSFVRRPASRVLISAVWGANEGIDILPPLVVHNADGSETEEIRKIYGRNGEA